MLKLNLLVSNMALHHSLHIEHVVNNYSFPHFVMIIALIAMIIGFIACVVGCSKNGGVNGIIKPFMYSLMMLFLILVFSGCGRYACNVSIGQSESNLHYQHMILHNNYKIKQAKLNLHKFNNNYSTAHMKLLKSHTHNYQRYNRKHNGQSHATLVASFFYHL